MPIFKFIPAASPAEDAEYELVGTPFSIQVSDDAYIVTEEGYDVEGDPETYWVRPVVTVRSLEKAKRIALALA
jgi:hypothetical protein